MKVLIEGYKYSYDRICDYISTMDMIIDGDSVIINSVGYYYNATVNECVFILPKVILAENDFVFGKYRPEEIVDFDTIGGMELKERRFISEFSIWIYRAISVYRESCIINNKSHSAIKEQSAIRIGKGKRKIYGSFLDIVLLLLDFNRTNYDWFMTVMKNNCRGYNKINWRRTVLSSEVLIQNAKPVYVNPVVKKRGVDFDEELFVIFFSILNHLKNIYGITFVQNANYKLITGKRFDLYLSNGIGLRRLRKLKYRYYSDKALALWKLCYDFFDQSRHISVESRADEYLLAKDFNIVFEAMIDSLIGDSMLPDRLNKNQNDGKKVDHIFLWKNLVSNCADKNIYYIGDSKYYKRSNEIDSKSIAKQYTYAKNVIQWNLDLFFGDGSNDISRETDFCLRDSLTEGYDIVPNFFISSTIPDDLSFADNIDVTRRKAKTFISRQFQNRLFDRDTLLITHYDVNFLFIVSLYTRSFGRKDKWRYKMRDILRENILKELNRRYNFYIMKAKQGVDTEEYISKNFRSLIGKIIAPYVDKSMLLLALDNSNAFDDENNRLITSILERFCVEKISLV